MLTSLIAFAMLAAGDSQPPAKSAKPAFDPNRMICKYSSESSSRLARRKVCHTAGEWAEQRRLDQQYLRQNQKNGAQ
jgi:hypothetical protein